MSTSVVTGRVGFLGSHLTNALLAKAHRVICIDNIETGSLANIEHRKPDITRARQLLGWESLENGLRRLRAALPSEAMIV